MNALQSKSLREPMKRRQQTTRGTGGKRQYGDAPDRNEKKICFGILSNWGRDVYVYMWACEQQRHRYRETESDTETALWQGDRVLRSQAQRRTGRGGASLTDLTGRHVHTSSQQISQRAVLRHLL